MSSTSAPFGFRPSFHNSGQIRPKAYTIATGLAADIFLGDPVKLSTAGTVVLGTSNGLRSGGATIGGENLLGVFAGVEYTDALGKPTESNYWPSGTSATNIVAYVYDDPETLYDVQLTNPSSGTTVQSYVGKEFDWTYSSTGGSTQTGLSNAQITTAQSGAGNFQMTGTAHNINDALTDAYIVVTVRLNEAHYKASVNTIS